MKRLSDVGEINLIRRYILPALSHRGSPILGDDCGWIPLGDGKVLLASCDALVEGSHYKTSWFGYGLLARKALRVSLSDIAAMGGAQSLGVLTTLGLKRKTQVRDFKNFIASLKDEAKRWEVSILGGDMVETTGAEFVVMNVYGVSRRKKLLLRSQARSGDLLWMTGSLGKAAAGLDVFRRGQEKSFPSLAQAQKLPPLCLKEGALLSLKNLSSCAIDLSDSLACSLWWLARMSNVRLEVDLRLCPIDAELARWCQKTKKDPLRYMLYGGEDYELLFTSRSPAAQIKKILPKAVPIGHVEKGTPAVTTTELSGKTLAIDENHLGYQAFKNNKY